MNTLKNLTWHAGNIGPAQRQQLLQQRQPDSGVAGVGGKAQVEQGEGGAGVGAGLFDGTVCIGSRNNLIAALLEDGYPRVFQRRVVFNNQYHSMG